MASHARKLILALLTVAATTAWAGPSSNEKDGPPRPPPHEILIENAVDLGIDESVQSEILALAEQARPDLEALHDAARAARGSATERDSMHALHDREKALMDDIRALLTDDQWESARGLLPPPPGREDGPPPSR